MVFSIRCVCGQTFDVPAGRAGRSCRARAAGRSPCPPLSELQKAADAGQVCCAEEYRERPASGEAAGDDVPREFFMILAPDHVIAQRVHQEAFVHFVAAFDRTLKSFVRRSEAQQGVDVQIGYAMFPGDRRLIDLQIRPETLPTARRGRVEDGTGRVAPAAGRGRARQFLLPHDALGRCCRSASAVSVSLFPAVHQAGRVVRSIADGGGGAGVRQASVRAVLLPAGANGAASCVRFGGGSTLAGRCAGSRSAKPPRVALPAPVIAPPEAPRRPSPVRPIRPTATRSRN